MTSAKRYALALFLLLLSLTASAQFYVTGSDPASARWHKIETPYFLLIYPEALDSLARIYGQELERSRIESKWSSGFYIGQNFKGRQPIVLHCFSTVPNAFVTWAPRRVDIFTAPDPYAPTPTPWTLNLALHEGRHVAQMQFGAAGIFRPAYYLFGEMYAGALAGIYPGEVLLEGDAVVAETALSKSGRGRQASFLNYMMPAFDCGDYRDYWKWVYGSQKYYAPDYYRAGYMLVAGTRVFFDEPLFTEKYFDRVVRKGGFFNLQKTVKEASGMKFKYSYRAIEENFHKIWESEALEREPFMAGRRVTFNLKGLHAEYKNCVSAGDNDILAIKEGLDSPASLVRISPDGKETRIRPFSDATSRLFKNSGSGRIYWTETVPDWRWPLKSASRIRYIETSGSRTIHDLTRTGKYFSCQPSSDGKHLSAAEYPVSGGSRLDIFSTADGSVEKVYIAPDSLQFTESGWIGDRLFATALSDEGMGLYEITGAGQDGKAVLRKIAGPQPVELINLDSWPEKNCLSFVCDRTGVNEAYVINVDSGKLEQVTSTKYGIRNPFLNKDADTLYYSSAAASEDPSTYRQGTMIYATATAELPVKEVRFDDIHKYYVADRLTEQEKALAGEQWSDVSDSSETIVSKPERYSKIRLPNVHSWAPFYFNYNNIDDVSADDYYKTASLGCTAMFQNLFGSGYGFAGYSAHENPDATDKWKHSGHLNYVYTGLLPAFEISADFNDRNRYDLERVLLTSNEKHSLYSRGSVADAPYLKVDFKTYVPVNLSSGGLSKGFIPQVKFTFTNDRYNDAISLERIVKKNGKNVREKTGSLGADNAASFSSLTLSARGYILRPVAPSQIYPSLGIGAEAGFHSRPGHESSFNDMAYVYIYGYLPGFSRQQGFRLSVSAEGVVGKKGNYCFPESAISTVPRGMVNSSLQSVINLNATRKVLATIDYAMPVFPVDWSFLGPVAYIRNFELNPFCDYAYQVYRHNEELYINKDNIKEDSMISVGADFVVRLGNFVWLPYGTRIGIRYAFNAWQNLESLKTSGLNHSYFGYIFSIDL